MKRDITTREDIALLVTNFYEKVLNDDTIGHIFRGIEGFSFESHMPIIIDFWETLLLGIASYKGNPMQKHLELNKLTPLNDAHFARWLFLWEDTVNDHFEGALAAEAVNKAGNIAGIMKVKLYTTDNGLSINKA